MDFDEIYAELQPKIRIYLSRLLGDQEADDCLQEVFAKVSRSLGSFKGQSKLSTWVYRIATNTAIDRLRSAAYRQSADQALFEDSARVEKNTAPIIQPDTPTDQKLIRKEMSACVLEYVDRLPPDYRAVLILKEIEGFKNRKIADILQITIDNVKVRLHRARTRLKQELDEGCDLYHNEDGTLVCDRKPILIDSMKPK